MVVGGLVLLQLPLIPVAAVADAAHEGLLPSVDPRVGHKPLSPEEALAASSTLVGKVSGVPAGMSVEFTPVTETFLTHRALERPLA